MIESMTKARGILYSPEMIHAKLEGRKTQTRRIVKQAMPPDKFADTAVLGMFKCPYGKVGDILYARETYQCIGFDRVGNHVDGGIWIYKADGQVAQDHLDMTEDAKWRPSLFMPKAAARIIDEITGIRVERLQDITPPDAREEGVEPVYSGPISTNGAKGQHGGSFPDHWVAFRSLWIKINGKASWDANPWVWIIETKNLSTTGWQGVSIIEQEKEFAEQ